MFITATYIRQDTVQGLTVCPELVEGWAVNPIMVRQAHQGVIKSAGGYFISQRFSRF
ncbi:hypothetical protein CRENPOLYSF1_1380001 [Crenothrix polyspora]|uniref:Uncharacterized protein n=1 Tax=Crenothrix polyspora TaxID=360316 RepID=A0A1R4H1T5_9GAMM|nr:hypothetical protein CRENPOLYSF1_1380001 [Crenothrix polyspora]